MTTIYVKNMVCDRCIRVVRQELEKTGFHPEKISLGQVALREDPLSDVELTRVEEVLKQAGFERIDDRKSRLIEGIKSEVIRRIHHEDRLDLRVNWSHILSEALHYDYHYLSGLFSAVEGITLEHYIIRQKIERVKELLLYDELSLSEISSKLGYSSVAHLSGQFKKITGFTPSAFKKSRDPEQGRRSIDHVR